MDLSNDLSALFARMGCFEERLDKATALTSPPVLDLATLTREFAEFKGIVWQVLKKLKSQMDSLSLGQERHEAFLRRKALLVHGVAERKDENVSEVLVNILSTKMHLSDITMGDLQSCHRLGAPSGKPRPVLVRFRELEVRHVVWESKTTLKNTGIVVSEFLTKSRHDIFMAARKHFGIRSCWSVDGKIAIILPDKSRKKIETAGELQSLVDVFPEAKDPVLNPGKEKADPSVSAAPLKSKASASKPPAAPVIKRTRK